MQDMTYDPRRELRGKISGAWYALLLIQILTVVNLVMLLLDTGSFFLFSASVPYYLTLLAMALDNGFSSGAWVARSHTYTALIVSVVILILYFLCWLRGKERTGWLTGAMVLFLLDSLALVLVSYLLYGNPLANVLDLFVHGWALWSLWQGSKAGRQLRELEERK